MAPFKLIGWQGRRPSPGARRGVRRTAVFRCTPNRSARIAAGRSLARAVRAGLRAGKEGISSRFFCQDDRITIADGLRAGRSVKAIAVELGKSYQSVYRQVRRKRKPGGGYQPWWAHNNAPARAATLKTAKIAGQRRAAPDDPQPAGGEVVTATDVPLADPDLPVEPLNAVCAATIYRACSPGS
jgi:hypothetical protein